jgi:Ca2+-transporting ATPase
MISSFFLQETLSVFRTSVERGLSSTEVTHLRKVHGYNEFSVSSPDSVILKFIKSIYENPLILLLCGSALVSAAMGNVDDAISITVAVLIVLTGENFFSFTRFPLSLIHFISGFRSGAKVRAEP